MKKYCDLSFAKIEKREKRQGFPEGVYCPGKTREEILRIAKEIIKNNETLLLTRAEPGLLKFLRKKLKTLRYSEKAKLIYRAIPAKKKGLIAVITAGTSDIPVAEEAALVAEILGNNVRRHFDVGVAGVHRLLSNLADIKKANVVIVAAGMDGVLPSIVGGLVSAPVIAIPTSVGYGISLGGLSALMTMMNSCASNVSVVNIDNGFSAGIIASLINQRTI